MGGKRPLTAQQEIQAEWVRQSKQQKQKEGAPKCVFASLEGLLLLRFFFRSTVFHRLRVTSIRYVCNGWKTDVSFRVRICGPFADTSAATPK
jgi:hypothetical protein